MAQDTLGETFNLFFGPTEETHGTGAVSRVVDGLITEVIVDEAEATEFAAEMAARNATHNADLERYISCNENEQ